MTHTTTPVPQPGRRARRRLALLATAGLVAAPLTTGGAPALAAAPAPAFGARTSALTSAVPAALASALPAAAVGKLARRGCTAVGTAVSCDLYAMAGTTSMNGGAPINIWGFSATDVAGTATAPGPLLVVNEGDTVTMTLHNSLAGQSVSLALPGQAVQHAGSVGDDTVGVGVGGSTTYTFTASHPGTFSYEAGHTAQGARQVAMGLAGALVVLPADGTAYGKAYDDDAVLVLSEIDPALNANPATFDMRVYTPKYALINGKPFPAADPISTDQGHTVLLRYVNVGSQTHPMSLLGADQTRLASDAVAMTYPEGEVTEAVDPGETAETLVTMPTGPEAKVTVYDASQHLDNNHQSTADPLQTSFGGMMTFLDTAAPPPSTDAVGPISTRVAAAPNPSNGLADVTVTAKVTDAASTVTQAEFAIDDATTTGPGFGTPMTGTFGTPSVDVSGTISVADLAALPAGKHIVYVRGLDSAGNWGVVGAVVFNLPKTGPSTTAGSVVDVPASGARDVTLSVTGDDTNAGGTITAAEYFVDTVGVDGQGTAMVRNRTATVVSATAVIPGATVKALGEGAHHLFAHTKDSLGLWGPTLDVALPVDLTGPGVDASSVAPNPSNAVLSDKANPGYLVVSAQITDRDLGGAVQNAVTGAEGFLNPTSATPAGGTGFQLIAVDGAFDSTTEAVYGLIPLSQIRPLASGTWTVAVHGKDAATNWGPLTSIPLYVDKVAPVVGTVTAAPNPAPAGSPVTLTAPLSDVAFTPQGAQYDAAETWVGTTDPGAGKGTPATFSVAGGTVSVTVTAPITTGTVQVNLRVQDKAGNWSRAGSVQLGVTRSTAIFASTFDTGLGAWNPITGNVSAVAAAGMPAGTPTAGLGLQVSYAAGLAKVASFVTDRSPAVETAYHAQLWMNANTLSAAATPLTLFDGRTANNGAVFAVQMRRNGTTVQLRTVLSRTGLAAVTGAWVNQPVGAHTVNVDWTSGPATGPTPGSLALKIDGTVVQTLTGDTSGIRLETVRLGVVAGVTATTVGSIWFDGFSSTR